MSKTSWASPQYVTGIAQRLWNKPEQEFKYTGIDFLKRYAKQENS